MQLSNKRIIVTGASGSIGQCIALECAKQGAQVLISYRSQEDEANETVAQLNALNPDSKALALYADFSNQSGIESFALEAIKQLGGVDILINNAGIAVRERLLELTYERMQVAFQVNTIAPLYLSQLIAKQMIDDQNKGVITNISSIAATNTISKGITYASSKAALNKWTENASLDLAPYGIRVNAVLPGIIEAGMNAKNAKFNPEYWHERTKNIPLKRPGQPIDIANMVLFLISDKANWITGKIIEVDDGGGLRV